MMSTIEFTIVSIKKEETPPPVPTHSEIRETLFAQTFAQGFETSSGVQAQVGNQRMAAEASGRLAVIKPVLNETISSGVAGYPRSNEPVITHVTSVQKLAINISVVQEDGPPPAPGETPISPQAESVKSGSELPIDLLKPIHTLSPVPTEPALSNGELGVASIDESNKLTHRENTATGRLSSLQNRKADDAIKGTKATAHYVLPSEVFKPLIVLLHQPNSLVQLTYSASSEIQQSPILQSTTYNYAETQDADRKAAQPFLPQAPSAPTSATQSTVSPLIDKTLHNHAPDQPGLFSVDTGTAINVLANMETNETKIHSPADTLPSHSPEIRMFVNSINDANQSFLDGKAIWTSDAKTVHSERTAQTVPHPIGTQGDYEDMVPTILPTSSPHILRTTPTELEVGLHNGAQGWVEIRAHIDSNGVVSTSMAAASPSGQEMLHKELPALTAYLQSEKVAVNAVMIHAAIPWRDGIQSSNSSELGAQQRSSQGENQRQGKGTSSQSEFNRTRKDSLPPDGSVPRHSITYLAGGGWLSIRA